MLNQSDPFAITERKFRVPSRATIISPKETLERLLDPGSFTTMRVTSGEQEEVPRKLAVWVPLQPGEYERERQPSDELLNETPGFLSQGRMSTRVLKQGSETPGAAELGVAENVKHLFIRAEWLAHQADNCVRSAISAGLSPRGQPLSMYKVTTEEALSKKSIGTFFSDLWIWCSF